MQEQQFAAMGAGERGGVREQHGIGGGGVEGDEDFAVHEG